MNMPVSDKYECILIHIPKTAGTSMEYVLGMHGDKDTVGLERDLSHNSEVDYKNFFGRDLQHLTFNELKKHLKMPKDKFNNYFKFAFVRNPWDRMVSEFSWDSNWNKGDGRFSRSYFRKKVFELFAKYKKDSLTAKHYIPQSKFIVEDDQVLVDFVGKYENLEQDWANLCNKLGINKDLPERMTSERKEYHKYYDSNTKKIISKIYARDIEIFNYKF